MPFGAPSYVVPKSGCRLRRPHDAISVADCGSTDAFMMSVFHALSAGNGRRPFSDPPGAGASDPLGDSGRVDDEHDTTKHTSSRGKGPRRPRDSKRTSNAAVGALVGP